MVARFKIFLLLILLPLNSFASSVSYDIFWERTIIGKATATLGNNSLRLDANTVNLMNTIMKYDNIMIGNFKLKNGYYVSESYSEYLKRRDKVKNVSIIFKNGTPSKTELTPPERDPRPKVDFNRTTVVDQITAIMNAHLLLKDSLSNKKDNFSLIVYDGKRVTKANAKIYLNERADFDYKSYIKVVITIEPISGYTDKELKNTKNNDAEITLYLNKDTLIPERIYAKVSMGSAYMVRANK